MDIAGINVDEQDDQFYDRRRPQIGRVNMAGAESAGGSAPAMDFSDPGVQDPDIVPGEMQAQRPAAGKTKTLEMGSPFAEPAAKGTNTGITGGGAGATQIGSSDHPITGSPDHPIVSMAGPNDSQLATDRKKLENLKAQGSPISRIHSPFWRGMAHVGDTLASTFLPGYAAMPWTDLKYKSNVRGAEQAVAEDLGENKEQAQTEQERAKAIQERSKAEEMLHPPAKVRDEELLYDKAGNAIGYRDAAGKYWSPDDLKKSGDPQNQAIADIIAQSKPKQPELKEGEMPLGDRVSQLNKMMERRWQLLQPGQALPAEYQLPQQAVQKDFDRVDKALEAMERANQSKSMQDEAMAIRQQMLELSKQGAQDRHAKVNEDEQKRGDLAKNMNENLDKLEEIVGRRPDLFGPFAGRMTNLKMSAGSSDPDIGALETLHEQLGMVQQSAHGMRSAHNVEAAAKSILNVLNEPKVILSSIKTARDSVQTFINDANRNQPGAGASVGTVHYREGNVDYDIPPEKVADFEKKHPNAKKQ